MEHRGGTIVSILQVFAVIVVNTCHILKGAIGNFCGDTEHDFY